MTHLVYHALSGVPGQSSPFDEAVLKVAKTGTVDIVSPYIGVDYIQRIIQVSEGWRLISDIEAWLSSLSMRARPRAWLFIRENLDRIHHCPAIHAKAVIGQQLAMFGSANLTNAGILGRTELGILIDDLQMVAELRQWFDTLWQQTQPPIADEANAFIQWLDDGAMRPPARREKFSLSAYGGKIRARLVKLPTPAIHEQQLVTINLEEIAQALIVQEQQHYDTLNEAVEFAINALAEDGFVFSQIVETIRRTFPASTTREVYFSLLQRCANHVRSVFAENTRNRLILVDKRFIQSSKELIFKAMAPFDSLLAHLVNHFDFVKARNIPDEDRLEALTGIRGEDQTILVSELLDCGFLEIYDIAGHLPQYTLSEDFEWDGRYKLFVKAMHGWNTKQNLSIKHPKIWQKNSTVVNSDAFALADISSVVTFDDSPSEPFFSGGKMTLSEFLRTEKAKTEKNLSARKEMILRTHEIRRNGVDKILSHLLLTLLSGKKLLPMKDLLLVLPSELGVSSSLVKQVVRGEESDTTNVILITKRGLIINPNLNWKDLAYYPQTQSICKSFLEM